MGKAEQLKQMRRMQEIQQKQTHDQQMYRNKMLAIGFACGVIVASLIFLPIALRKPATPSVSNLTGVSASPVTLPKNIQLQPGTAGATPLALPQQ